MQHDLNHTSPLARSAAGLRQLIERVRSFGLPYSLQMALHRVLPEFVLRVSWIGIYQIDLPAASPDGGDRPVAGDIGAFPSAHCQHLHLRWATPEDIDLFAELDFVDLVRERFGIGQHAAIAIGDGRLVGYVWFARNRYREGELFTEFHIPRDGAWLHTARIARQWRRQGLYKNLLKFAFAALHERGVSRVLLSVERLNRPSIAAHKSAGAKRIGSCLMIRLLGITACLGSGTRRRRPRLSLGTFRSPCRLPLDGTTV